MKVVMFAPWDTEGQLDYVHSLCQSLGKRCDLILVTGVNYLKEIRSPRSYAVRPFLRGILLKRRIKALRVLKLVNYLIFLGRFYFFLARTKPQVVHFQFLVFPLVDKYFLLLIKKKFILVMTVHDIAPHTNNSFLKVGLDDCFKEFHKLIVHSRFAKNQLVSVLRQSYGDIRIIPHGPYSFMFDTWPPISKKDARVSIGFSGGRLLVMIGSILPYKGHLTAIKIVELLRKEFKLDVTLIIAGSSRGESIDQVMQEVKKLGLERSVLIRNRFLTFTEIRNLMCAADAGIMPYKEITTSGPIHMLQTYGVPVISTKVGGAQDVIKEGVNGLFIDENDLKVSAGKIFEVLNSERKLAVMKSNALYRVNEKLSWENIARFTSDYYEGKNLIDVYYWE
jgi:glycosyltransferase involved in cell wall biosynthesis